MRHAPNRLGYNRDGDEFEPMKQPDPDWSAQFASAVSEEHQSNRRRQGKAGPCRKPAAIAGAHEANRKSDLAAGGTWQELT